MVVLIVAGLLSFQLSQAPLVAGQDMTRAAGETRRPTPGIAHGASTTGSADFGKRLGALPQQTRAAPRHQTAQRDYGERDQALACDRYWFGRTSERRRIEADHQDACAMLRHGRTVRGAPGL